MESNDANNIYPIVLAVIAAGVALFYTADRFLRSRSEQSRTSAFFQLSRQLDFHYQMGKDKELPHRFFFIQRLAHGTNRYAVNSLSGEYSGYQFNVFDYHYETQSATGNKTTLYDISVILIHVKMGDAPADFPNLIVSPEGARPAWPPLTGAEDINFDSLEFSRQFSVRSKNKKFAYDVCHGQLMEYLLANPGLTLEYNLYTIALIFNRRLKPEEIQPNLNRLLTVRSLVPDYLLTPA